MVQDEEGQGTRESRKTETQGQGLRRGLDFVITSFL